MQRVLGRSRLDDAVRATLTLFTLSTEHRPVFLISRTPPTMGDDPCECLFNHEAAMRRLLSLLRDTQDYCTDSECLTDGGPTAIATNSILLWTMLWGFLALVLFFLRPNSMRSNGQGLGKPGPSNDRRDNQPPPPGVM